MMRMTSSVSVCATVRTMALQQPECDEPVFRVFEPIIQYSHRLACKQGFEISEVYAVLFEI